MPTVAAPTGTTTVVIAEDHALFSQALQATLDDAGTFCVIDVVTDGAALIEAYRTHRPDLVVTDLSMRPVGGIEATRAIRDLDPDARVLALSAFTDRHLVRGAAEAGVVGFLNKCSRGPQIVEGLRAAASGRTAFDDWSTQVLIDTARGNGPLLTDRQVAVLRGRADGKQNVEIARELHISLPTVKDHLSAVYQRLEVNCAEAAVLRACQLGLLGASDDPDTP